MYIYIYIKQLYTKSMSCYKLFPVDYTFIEYRLSIFKK